MFQTWLGRAHDGELFCGIIRNLEIAPWNRMQNHILLAAMFIELCCICFESVSGTLYYVSNEVPSIDERKSALGKHSSKCARTVPHQTSVHARRSRSDGPCLDKSDVDALSWYKVCPYLRVRQGRRRQFIKNGNRKWIPMHGRWWGRYICGRPALACIGSAWAHVLVQGQML